MSSLSALRWRTTPIDAIAWREWDGEYVVRSERSGNTHLLGPLAGRVLQVLLDASSALNSDDIAAELSDELAATDAAERKAAIEAALSEFKRLGLAEPVQE